MKRLTAWAGHNIDGVIAIIIAAVIAGLDVFSDIPQSTMSSGILLVLGVLAVSVLRDRNRTDENEERLREDLRRVGDVPPTVVSLGEAVAEVGRVLNDMSMVRTLTWPEVTAALADARRTTDRWVFRGGTGTYIRAKTLPGCVTNSRRDRRGLLVRLEIIDPTNEEVCASYARFRHSLATERDWTLERTQRESYATVVACCWYRQRYELLDVGIGLSQVMPTLRWDLSGSGLLVTQEDPRKPALLVERGKLLYEYFHTELRKSFEQARPVPLDDVRHLELSDVPTVDEVRKLFVGLNMPLPNSFSDRDVSDVIDRTLHAENRYDP
ncbi:MAG TPA: hypothetical protein VFX70_17640 [Mycobacteriales bacterium]|nr:hypothetical protein [Mycobacteriales bacterium]